MNSGARKAWETQKEIIRRELETGKLTLKPMKGRQTMVCYIMNGGDIEALYCVNCSSILSKNSGGGYTTHIKLCKRKNMLNMFQSPNTPLEPPENRFIVTTTKLEPVVDDVDCEILNEVVDNKNAVSSRTALVLPSISLAVEPLSKLPDNVDITYLTQKLSTPTVPINTPSEGYFHQTLTTLKMSFSRQMFKFWSEVEIVTFNSDMKPVKLYNLSSQEDSFFRVLSLFFTGTEEKHRYIKRSIQFELLQNFKSFGVINNVDFTNMISDSSQFDFIFDFASPLKAIHFEVVCKILKCTLAIFYKDRLKIYGNWKDNLLPKFFIHYDCNNFYQPVIALK